MSAVDPLRRDVDVVVVGGGPAGAWAALHASETGARVLLVDKGYCGTSGAAASSGSGMWVLPDDGARENEIAQRLAQGEGLSEATWMARVLEHTPVAMSRLGSVGRYPFPRDESGRPVATGVQGPEYLRRMRAWLRRVGVEVVDHAPALSLLRADDEVVVGVRGVFRRAGGAYEIHAGAVVLVTGGCGLLGGALGTHTNTGDGHLMAVEAGADLSGMEFSNAYSLSLRGASVTKSAYFQYAHFYRADGTRLEGSGARPARALVADALATGAVYAQLERADEVTAQRMRLAQPNFFLPFDRSRIDPFAERFEVTLLAEGTVRGTGGVRLGDDDCGTGIAGLYVAGDVATREPICGAVTGGGALNASWAICSGAWAGAAAGRHALREARRAPRGAGEVTGVAGDPERVDGVRALARRQLVPLEVNHRRSGQGLTRSLGLLDAAWRDQVVPLPPVVSNDPAEARAVLRAREVAALVAVGRWMYRSALLREESRGMARRVDHARPDPRFAHRILAGGTDAPWVRSA